jgi:hypothetical protein
MTAAEKRVDLGNMSSYAATAFYYSRICGASFGLYRRT